MEGIVILSNNKPLVASFFQLPRIADLAIDAFLEAKRASNRTGQSVSLEPIIWFEGFRDSRHEASRAVNGVHKGKGRRDAYSARYSIDSEESEEESDSEDDSDGGGEQHQAATEIDPWAPSTSKLDLSSPGSTGTSFACCHIEHNNLDLLVPVSKEADPAVAFAYLYSLLGVLQNYLNGDVTDGTLRDNFDVVLQLFEETFSAPHPVSTDASALQELVPTSNVLSNILSAGIAAVSNVGSSSQASTVVLNPIGGPSPFSSPLHWRRAGIKHAQNEIYFDVHEEISAVLDKNEKVISGGVYGRIDCKSKLSGMPDISLSFSNPAMLEDVSFHPCVRLGKWLSTKLLSFVPPDGKFSLMGYRLGSQSGVSRRNASQGTSEVPVPVRIRPTLTLGELGGSFTISLSPPTVFTAGGVPRLEDVIVSLYLGEDATGVTASITSSNSNSSMSLSSSTRQAQNKSPPGGSWEFDTITSTLKWRIPKLLSSNAPTLTGTWNFGDLNVKAAPAPFVSIEFKAPLTNISGLSIVNLSVEGERYSVYKGFRSHLSGRLEVRW